MKLDQIPVRLDPRLQHEWRALILGLYERDTNGAGKGEADLRSDLEDELESIKSVRAPLSRFLNGHGDEIRKWLCGENGVPSPKGETLANLCGVSVGELAELLLGLLPHNTTSNIRARDLRKLDFTIVAPDKGDQKTEHTQLSRWFEQVVTKGDRVIVRIASTSNTGDAFPYSRRYFTLERELLGLRQEEYPQCNVLVEPDPNEDEDYTPSEDDLIVYVAPLSLSNLSEWFERLYDNNRLNQDMYNLLREQFEALGALVVRWKSTESLLGMINALISGQIDAITQEKIFAYELEAKKRPLVFEKGRRARAWAIQSHVFFKKWYCEGFASDTRVTREELEKLLRSESGDDEPEGVRPGTLSTQDWVDVIDAILHSPARQQQLVTEWLESSKRSSMTSVLETAGVIKRCDDRDFFMLSEGWAEVGSMEFARYLEPEELSSFYQGKNLLPEHDTAMLAILFAKPERLNDWIEASMEAPSWIKTDLFLGLSSRDDRAEGLADVLLQRFWASVICDNRRSHECPPSMLARATRVFGARLPKCISLDPLAELEALAQFRYDADCEVTQEDYWAIVSMIPSHVSFDFVFSRGNLDNRVFLARNRGSHTLPLSAIAREHAKTNRAARRLLWGSKVERTRTEPAQLLEWVPSLIHDDAEQPEYCAPFRWDEILGSLEHVLEWGRTQGNKRDYINAVKHLLAHCPWEQLVRGWSGEHGRIPLGEDWPDGLGDPPPRLFAVFGLNALQRFREQNSRDELDEWMTFLTCPRSEQGHAATMRARICETIDLAVLINDREVLEHALGLNQTTFDKFRGIDAYDQLQRHDQELVQLPVAHALQMIFAESHRGLHKMGIRKPLRSYVRQREPFWVASLKVRNARLLDETCRQLDNHPAHQVSDTDWKMLIDWLLPNDRFVEGVRRIIDASLYPEAFDQFDSLDAQLRSPWSHVDPARRTDVIRGCLSRRLKNKQYQIPYEIIQVLTQWIDLGDCEQGLARVEEDMASLRDLVCWARAHDKVLFSEWYRESLEAPDPSAWDEIEDWLVDGALARVENVWEEFYDEHKICLLKRLSDDRLDGKLVASSPVLDDLILLEQAEDQIALLRRHDITGKHRVETLHRMLEETSSQDFEPWKHRVWCFLFKITSEERELLSAYHDTWRNDRALWAKSLEETPLRGCLLDDHYNAVAWWCTDEQLVEDKQLLIAHIGYTTRQAVKNVLKKLSGADDKVATLLSIELSCLAPIELSTSTLEAARVTLDSLKALVREALSEHGDSVDDAVLFQIQEQMPDMIWKGLQRGWNWIPQEEDQSLFSKIRRLQSQLVQANYSCSQEMEFIDRVLDLIGDTPAFEEEVKASIPGELRKLDLWELFELQVFRIHRPRYAQNMKRMRERLAEWRSSNTYSTPSPTSPPCSTLQPPQ